VLLFLSVWRLDLDGSRRAAHFIHLGLVLNHNRSRHSTLVRVLFFSLNLAGLAFGLYYNLSTPDLYEGNLHHTLGWLLMALVLVLSLLRAGCACIQRSAKVSVRQRVSSILPGWLSFHCGKPRAEVSYHKVEDESFESEESSPPSHSEQASNLLGRETQSTNNDGNELPAWHLSRLATTAKLKNLPQLPRAFPDWAFLMAGYIVLCSGWIVCGGLFVSPPRTPMIARYGHLIISQRGIEIFNGLAHVVRGSIFYWYGVFTLCRWAGCFARLGWDWESQWRTPSFKRSCVSVEFIESFLIFFYGATNMFLEHLAAWGKTWSVMDLEHVSIAVIFFGAGLVRLTAYAVTKAFEADIMSSVVC
jgi:hypothetical protein